MSRCAARLWGTGHGSRVHDDPSSNQGDPNRTGPPQEATPHPHPGWPFSNFTASDMAFVIGLSPASS